MCSSQTRSHRMERGVGACELIYELTERGATNCPRGADDLKLQQGNLDLGFASIISACLGVLVVVVRNVPNYHKLF